MLKSPNSISKLKYWILVLIILIFHLLLAYRFFQVQILDHDIYSKQADSNRIRATSIPSPRGLILDRNGEIIVDNYPTYILYGIDAEIINKNKNYEIINKTTGIDISILKKNYKNNYRNKFLPVRLAKDLTISQLSRLEEEHHNLSGIIYKQFPERIFNRKIRASHVLGYLKEINNEMLFSNESNNYQLGDLVGWTGIEKQYESTLKGMKGVSYHQVDAFGREKEKIELENSVLPIPGKNIYTSLDINLQSFIEKEFEGKTGVVIVSKPKTGEILSFLSSPDYKPDLFTGLVSNDDWKMIIDDPNKPLLNRATNGLYPPGSIFKMVVLIELLERNLLSTEWSVLCTGQYEYFDRVHRCWDENGHGKINMKDALIQSCDIYFYEAVQRIKLDNLYLRAKEFGYGLESNLDLPNEMKGRMPNRDFMNKLYGKWGWSKGALLNISIGQGEILSTPVQMANYINLIATNGDTYPLNLVRGNIAKLNRPQVKLKNWQIIQDAMREVVIGNKGTGKLSDPKLPGLSIYGKTGTAENPHGEAHAWYITYGEKNNEMISIVVLIENGGSGGTYATPITRKIYNYYFNSNKSKFAKN
tara:strand:- start:497 stop:2260 length:1764 start_codon:yes stop_codon:yes gene_type:complete